MTEKRLTPTEEDYLEVILNLEKDKKIVRVKDIAEKMMVRLPTVTSMLNTLVQEGLVIHEKYEYVELTKKGKNIAREVWHRHITIRNFLTNILHIDDKIADEDACKMEHAITPVTLERFVKFMEFIKVCPRAGSDWVQNFDEYRLHGRLTGECIECMEDLGERLNAKIKDMEKRKK
ncbi:MAG: metal-dependent transcriptional regulator [Deltaproteobacteria bacterium]|nr:metal-dependent transcriptional regulator [Deltaproteobacteria bacterium]